MSPAGLTLPERAQFDSQGFACLAGPAITDLKAGLETAMLSAARLAAQRLLPDALYRAAPDTGDLETLVAWLHSVEQDNAVTRALYEIFPTLPGVIAAIDHPALRAATQWAGLALPSAGTLPLVRLDRPGDTRFATPAHQDYWYSLLSPNAVTLWLPLCRLDDAIGPLRAVPGSHAGGLVPFQRHEAGHEWFETAEAPDDAEFIDLPMGRDDILIFNQALVHKSGTNRSERVRISVQFRFNDLATAQRLTSTYTPSLSRHVLDSQARHLDARNTARSPAA